MYSSERNFYKPKTQLSGLRSNLSSATSRNKGSDSNPKFFLFNKIIEMPHQELKIEEIKYFVSKYLIKLN
jgi:hypothetical protein